MKTKQTCSRCGGSGKYSFNMLDGDVCYGCRGRGFQMVDVAALARKQAAAMQREVAASRAAEQYKQAMAATKSELNLRFGPFDLTTEIGLDRLNHACFKGTGKDLVQHCQERMAA